MNSVSTPASEPTVEPRRGESLLVYLALGTFLGMLFIKSEVASWFRIQEMFHFRAVHMYGVIGGAVLVGAVAVALMKRFRVRTFRGEEILFPSGDVTRPRTHHIVGGTMFGLGWGIMGACPGPLFALVGSGLTIMLDMCTSQIDPILGALGDGEAPPEAPYAGGRWLENAEVLVREATGVRWPGLEDRRHDGAGGLVRLLPGVDGAGGEAVSEVLLGNAGHAMLVEGVGGT